MGWANGSRLLDDIAMLVMPSLSEQDRPVIARALIDIFKGEDCDTICECVQQDIQREYQNRGDFDPLRCPRIDSNDPHAPVAP